VGLVDGCGGVLCSQEKRCADIDNLEIDDRSLSFPLPILWIELRVESVQCLHYVGELVSFRVDANEPVAYHYFVDICIRLGCLLVGRIQLPGPPSKLSKYSVFCIHLILAF